MRKSIALLIISGFASTTLVAKPSPEKFYYNQGYKDGKKEGMRLGYKKAKQELLESFKKRLTELNAMDAGKYLSRKHKITAPQIYQVKNPDGSLSVEIKGCQLEKELTPEEILMLPPLPQGTPRSTSVKKISSTEVGVSDGVFIPGIDSFPQSTAHLASSTNDVVYVNFPNTEFYLNILRSSGLPFTMTNGNNDLKVRFESYKDRDNFLTKYDLEPGRDAK